jgi:nucleotide-binding universal stress UspA family protein
VYDRWKILAPVDLGSDAEARVEYALNVAEAIQGDLTLLYVMNGRLKRAEPVEWPPNAMATHGAGEVRRLVLVGEVAETVGNCAAEMDADLVLVPAGSYRWWNRLRSRPAAARIASSTDRPVWFDQLPIRRPATAFRSVLCVVALDGTDDPLLQFSEEVARRSDATLILLHVVPDVSEALIAYGTPGMDDRPLSREVAEKRLRELTAGLSHPHLTAIATGSAYRSIAKLAREHQADVVITGRRKRAMAGLDAGAVLSWVSCPVIAVPVGAHSAVRRGSGAVARTMAHAGAEPSMLRSRG